jgi:Fe-S oxidoreductase
MRFPALNFLKCIVVKNRDIAAVAAAVECGWMVWWLTIRPSLSENRVKEAVEVGAEVLAVCCPYEVSRFEDAVKSTNNDGKLIVMDIIEIMDYCMGDDAEA